MKLILLTLLFLSLGSGAALAQPADDPFQVVTSLRALRFVDPEPDDDGVLGFGLGFRASNLRTVALIAGVDFHGGPAGDGFGAIRPGLGVSLLLGSGRARFSLPVSGGMHVGFERDRNLPPLLTGGSADVELDGVGAFLQVEPGVEWAVSSQYRLELGWSTSLTFGTDERQVLTGAVLRLVAVGG